MVKNTGRSPGPQHRGSETGQTMAEYAVVLAVITGGIIAGISLLSATTTNMISQVIGFL